MRLTRPARNSRARARLATGVVLATCLAAGLVAADKPEEARGLVERFAQHLEARDATGLAALYHDGASHRDLANGEVTVGPAALRDLYARRLTGAPTGPVRIDSYRRVVEGAAIAQLTWTGSPSANGGESWPPYLAVVVSLEDGRWGVAATRAGGNPGDGAPQGAVGSQNSSSAL